MPDLLDSNPARADALLAAIRADPDDMGSYRVLGDLLTGTGDLRGELVQIQCDLEELVVDDPPSAERFASLARRERAILAKNERAWVAPLGKAVIWSGFRRGLVSSVRVKMTPFLQAMGAAFEREPIVDLGARGVTKANADALAASPELARVRKLSLTESRLGSKGVRALFASEHVRELQELDLYQAGIDDEGLALLREMDRFPRLESLGLSGNRLSPDAIVALFGDPRASALRSLALGWIASGRDGAQAIAERLALPALETLDLVANRYDDEAVAILARSPNLRRLRSLRLEQNGFGPRGAEALTALSALTELDVSTNPLGVPGATALARGAWPALERLDLMQTEVGDEGMQALAGGTFPRLKVLDARYCAIGPRGAEALANAGWPLEELDLWSNAIADDGAAALARSPFASRAREVTLAHNAIGDAGVMAIAAASWPYLRRLELRGNPIGPEGAKALDAATGMPALVEVSLEQTSAPLPLLKSLRKRLGAGLVT